MRILLLLLILAFSVSVFAQKNQLPMNKYQSEFDYAYSQYPDVPKGLLEAVSFTMTRFNHNQNIEESCTGMPKTYGVMGLTLDGKNYFRNNLKFVATVSGISIEEIIESPQQNILAYAATYHHQLMLLSPFYYKSQNYAHLISTLSELPNATMQQEFALNSHLYSVLSFLNDTKMQKAYHFEDHQLDLIQVFGEENLKVLQSSSIIIGENFIEGDEGQIYKKSGPNNKSIDYPAALSDFTTCNFSSRSGTVISAVTIHTIQGTYAGCISWFKNCSANVSAHYVLRSSDGQVTQQVLESDKGWHVGSENPYTIGLEHEGFVNDSTWYTAAMYQSSANLVIDITQSGYGINPLRTAYFPWTSTTNYNATGTPGGCIKVKGHQHYPNQSHTDPGANWDWDYFYKLINDPTSTTIVNTNPTGNVTDAGGAGNYTDDERSLFLIQPTNATTINLTVNQFDIEPSWDYLYIYDGVSVFDPLIGRYDGTSIPSSFVINGGAVLIEFRTDCATTAPGFDISWSSVITGVDEYLKSDIKLYPNPVKEQLTIAFENSKTGQLWIRDITGRIIVVKQLNQTNKLIIPVQDLSKGVYFLNFENTTIKFVKQ